MAECLTDSMSTGSRTANAVESLKEQSRAPSPLGGARVFFGVGVRRVGRGETSKKVTMKITRRNRIACAAGGRGDPCTQY